MFVNDQNTPEQFKRIMKYANKIQFLKPFMYKYIRVEL